MTNKERLAIYLRQVGEQKYVDGLARLTPRQRKRIALKDHRLWKREI